MAAVTSEILNNMLRTSLTDLKSFVELLNAVLAEEGQGTAILLGKKNIIKDYFLFSSLFVFVLFFCSPLFVSHDHSLQFFL